MTNGYVHNVHTDMWKSQYCDCISCMFQDLNAGILEIQHVSNMSTILKPHVMKPHVMKPHVMKPHVMELHVMKPHVMKPHVMKPHGRKAEAVINCTA